MAQEAESWWQTLPGVLTALTGIITAVGTLIVALHQVGLLGNGDGQPQPPGSLQPTAATNQAMLINVRTAKCLTISGGVSTENNIEAVQFDCDSHPSRRWWINDVGGVFQIKNVQTGKCLTISGGVSTENNIEAVQFDCDSHPSRTWKKTN